MAKKNISNLVGIMYLADRDTRLDLLAASRIYDEVWSVFGSHSYLIDSLRDRPHGREPLLHLPLILRRQPQIRERRRRRRLVAVGRRCHEGEGVGRLGRLVHGGVLLALHAVAGQENRAQGTTLLEKEKKKGKNKLISRPRPLLCVC